MRFANLVKVTCLLMMLTAIPISQSANADLVDAANDLDAVVADFSTIVDHLNANFYELNEAINSIGGSATTPYEFFPESLGSDDLANAADHLRFNDLSASADDLDAVAADFSSIVVQLNASFYALNEAINSIGGSATTPHEFFPESLGSNDLVNAADHLRFNAFSAAADDLDAVVADFSSIVVQLNANFYELSEATNSIGGNSTVPVVFFPESIGADDLTNAAIHLRNTSIPEPGGMGILAVLSLTGLIRRHRKG